MAGFYFVDTSALAKRYIAETGSDWLRGVLDTATGHKVLIARTTAIEIFAAISCRERGGTLSRKDAKTVKLDLHADLENEYQVVEVTGTLANFAMQFAELYGLRAHTAIHLTAVMKVNILQSTLAHRR